MNDQEKAVIAAVTIKDFFQKFGGPNDKFSSELVSILLEELCNVKVVSLLSEPMQERDEISHDISSGQGSEFNSDEFRGTEITTSMEDGSRQNIE